MPDELQNRRADNWRIQFAIADLAGLDWGDKARAAAINIEGKTDNRTVGVRLLADIKALFDADPEAHCMHSAAIVTGLARIRRNHGLSSPEASRSPRTVSPSSLAPTRSRLRP
jgi:hypothetical protein